MSRHSGDFGSPLPRGVCNKFEVDGRGRPWLYTSLHVTVRVLYYIAFPCLQPQLKVCLMGLETKEQFLFFFEKFQEEETVGRPTVGYSFSYIKNCIKC